MTIELLIQKIQTTNFFANLGKTTSFSPNIILIDNLNSAFINPPIALEKIGFEQAKWLPSSPFDNDPFYGDIELTAELKQERKAITQAVFRAFGKVDCQKFIYQPHDFTQVAKQNMAFAFRQYLVEQGLNLGTHWQDIIEIYFLGHWAIAYDDNHIYAI